MRGAGAPMLFSAPRPPVWIPRTRRLRLGRAPECDFPIDSPEASRQHAEVRVEDGQVVLVDLASTNGTRVNGEEIHAPRTLRPGDRIEIGGVVVTYCQVDPRITAAPNAADETAVLDHRSGNAEAAAFRGDLAEVPAVIVLQMLESGRMTGALRVLAAEGPILFYVSDGRPIHARTRFEDGVDAVVVLLEQRAGPFEFDRGRAPEEEESIDESMTSLLLEASRRIDEGSPAEAAQRRSSGS